MAYQGVPDHGYGQDPTQFPSYDQSNQHNQMQWSNNPTLPYQANLAPNSNFNQNAHQTNSFSPVINYPSSAPAYPQPTYPPAQQTWPNTSRARTHSDTAFSQPAPKRQRIDPPSNQSPGLQRYSSQPNSSRPVQMAHASNSSHSTPTRPLPVHQNHVHAKPLEPDSQYKLLLPLAEEFFEAAYATGYNVARKSKPEKIQSYQKLIATGLSCLEAALKENRMPPRLEAKVTIRYASVMYSDTLCYMEAEVALSKGITLCERNHLVDLKYMMQYILAKVLYKSGPKAAYKALDLHVEDARAYKHYSWVYAFRFLRASLSLESGNSIDAHAGLQHLQSIAELANSRDDRAVYLVAVLFQAMTHLRSGKADSIQQVQTSLAAVRAWQFSAAGQIPQLLALTHILDLTCSILNGVPSETITKLKAMQKDMDPLYYDQSTWTEFDENIIVPINGIQGHPQAVTSDTRALLDVSEDGTERLILSWCDKRTMSAINYALAGMAWMHKAGAKDEKALKYFQEGLRVFSGNPKHTLGSAPEMRSKLQRQYIILCYIHVYSSFWHAARTEWAKLDVSLSTLKDLISARGIPTDGPLGLIINYLTGVYLQGTGDLDNALKVFESDQFSLLHPKTIVTAADRLRNEISLLAKLNSLWIYQEPGRTNASRNHEVLEKLETLCQASRMEDFKTALKLIRATIRTEPPTLSIKIKSYLIEAMDAARRTSNTQFLCITLSVMSHRFFKDIVGLQAEKSSKAAAHQANVAGNRLWMSVAEGVLASCLEIQQQLPEAENARQRAIALARKALSTEDSG